MLHESGGFCPRREEAAATPAQGTIIFDREVPVRVKKAARDEFLASLRVKLRTDLPAHPRLLKLELTDEADLFFYNCLTVGEEDFHKLKVEQGINVDFQSFPVVLVETLERCCGGQQLFSDNAAQGVAAAQVSPLGEMVVSLDCTGGVNSDSLLTFIEPRQLVNASLKLRLRPGTDDVVKQHLAAKVQLLQKQNTDISERLAGSEAELSRLRRLAEELSTKARSTAEERLHLEQTLVSAHQREVAELLARHAQEFAQAQREACEAKSTVEARLQTSLDAALARASSAELHLDESKERTRTLDASGRHAAERSEQAEGRLRQCTQEVQDLREQVKQLDTIKFAQEQEASQLRVLVAASREQHTAKDQLLANHAALVDQASMRRSSLEVEHEQCKSKLKQYEGNISQLCNEVTKGNDIIRKMKGKQMKLKDELTARTGDLESSKKSILESSRLDQAGKHTVQELEHKLELAAGREMRHRQEEEEFKSRLLAAEEKIKNDKEVIEYLNKSLSKQDIGGLGTPMANDNLFRVGNAAAWSPKAASFGNTGGAFSSSMGDYLSSFGSGGYRDTRSLTNTLGATRNPAGAVRETAGIGDIINAARSVVSPEKHIGVFGGSPGSPSGGSLFGASRSTSVPNRQVGAVPGIPKSLQEPVIFKPRS